MTESPLFKSIDLMRLRPGDVLIFRAPERMSDAARAHVADMLDEVFPDHESIILEGGQTMDVLRPEPGMFARLFKKASV